MRTRICYRKKNKDPESMSERGQECDTHTNTQTERKRKRVWDKGVGDGMNGSSGYKTNFNALKC